MMVADGTWPRLGEMAADALAGWGHVPRVDDVPWNPHVGMEDRPLPPLEAYPNEDPGTARSSCFYSAASLKGRPVPDREWLVQDLIPSNTVTLGGGDGGAGKSLLFLQLAASVTAQTSWLGKAVTSGRAIFLSAEDDDDELHRRVEDIRREAGRSYEDLEGLTLRSLAGEDALLAVDSQLALIQSALFKELDARAADDAPALIVIDKIGRAHV